MKKNVWHIVFQEKQLERGNIKTKESDYRERGSLIEETYVNWINRLYGEECLYMPPRNLCEYVQMGAQELMSNYFAVLKRSGLGTKITTNII